MPQSLSKILIHVIFSTKNRAPKIAESIEPKLHAYIAATIRELGCEAYRVGGTSDHVHIACSLSRTTTVSKLLETIKSASSKWMKEQGAGFSDFAWQSGYAVFSLGESQLPVLLKYIENQKEHHATVDFKEELIQLFEKYEVAFDERYVWE